MRCSLAGLMLILVVGAAPAHAASGLDSARQEAKAARERVNEIRAQQMALRSELNQVAARIEALKERKRGALLKGGELESSLRRSQHLSGLLTDAAQRLSSAEADLERNNLALLATLSSELEALRNRWERTPDRQERAALLQSMREIRAESEQVRAALPAARVPALEVRGSDDPEDLMEQADALRDSEDKVRQQMKSLQARIAEIRRERELDRRMSDFLGEERLFDEQDRRLRSATGSGSGSLRTSGGTPPASSDTAAPESTFTSGPTGGGPSLMETPTPVSSTPTATGGPTTPGTIPESRPLVGGADPLTRNGVDSRELSALEAKLKNLESLAQQLNARASAIEARARESR
jgi:phage shock protein A